MKRLTAAMLVALTASAASAQTFTAQNHLDVSAPSPDQITVFGPAELWARDYWCAVGDYAFRRLGLDFTDRLQVVRPYQSSDESVVFGVGGTPASVFSLAATVRTPGANLSVGQARSYCADRIIRSSR